MALAFFDPRNEKKKRVVYNPLSQTRDPWRLLAHCLVQAIENEHYSTPSQLKGLLVQIGKYYPTHLPMHVQKKSNEEQLSYLMTYTQPHDTKLEQAITYSLQKMVIIMMYEHPELYCAEVMDGVKPEELVKQKGLLSNGIFLALADGLGVNLFVEAYPEQVMETPTQLKYDSDSSVSFHLQYKDKDYIAESSRKEKFNSAETIITVPQPSDEASPSLEEASNSMHENMSKAFKRYSQALEWVNGNLVEGHISVEQLKDIALSASPKQTHYNPMEAALRSIWVDGNYLNALGDEGVKTNIWGHLAAVGLATSAINHTAFPPICNDDSVEPSKP